MPNATSTPINRLDPTLRHSRREAVVILIAFAALLIWSVTFCYLAGYHQPVEGRIAKVLGIPAWVFWGVLIPWLAADLFTIWFCFRFMANDPLDQPSDPPPENV